MHLKRENNSDFYKYLPDTEGSLKAIVDNTMKFSHPSTFNDPFDCRPNLIIPKLDDLKHLKPKIPDHGIDPKLISGSKWLFERRKMLARIKNDIASGSFQDNMIKNVGVASFSLNPRNILMWSHYADNHKGYLLHFSSDKLPAGLLNRPPELQLQAGRYNLLTYNIQYMEKLPEVPTIRIDEDTNKLLDMMLLTKSLDWKYEEEVRAIDHVQGEGIYSYNPSLLKSIVLGMCMSEERCKEIQDTIKKVNKLRDKPIKVYKAHASKDAYKIIIPDF
jgi:hypothetical protein